MERRYKYSIGNAYTIFLIQYKALSKTKSYGFF